MEMLEIINTPNYVYTSMETYFFDVLIQVDRDFFNTHKKKEIRELCREYVDEKYFVPSSPSAYDCTGQHFSKRSQVIAYDKIYRLVTVRHWKGIDI